jgi:hypothetical protein
MDHINTKRYRDCLKLYIDHRGQNIKQIEREMRELGHADFHRRILYSRTERGERKPGWIEKYGWREYLSTDRPSSPAPPPDVRKGCAFPASPVKNKGLCLRPDRQHSRKSFNERHRKGRAFPHIERAEPERSADRSRPDRNIESPEPQTRLPRLAKIRLTQHELGLAAYQIHHHKT